MKRSCLLAAAASIVIISNLWVPIVSRLNQREAAGGTLELTEAELALVPRPGESTVRLLEFRWRVEADEPRMGPRWLDQAKLSTLGFDCRMPLTAAHARKHYQRVGTRPAWLVLGLAESSGPPPADARARSTRLLVLDAGTDPTALRHKYPDRTRHVLAPGVVRLSYFDRTHDSPEAASAPRLQGWIVLMAPGQMFVPGSLRAVLDTSSSKSAVEKDQPKSDLHYTATVCWGARHTPWLKDLQLRQ